MRFEFGVIRVRIGTEGIFGGQRMNYRQTKFLVKNDSHPLRVWPTLHLLWMRLRPVVAVSTVHGHGNVVALMSEPNVLDCFGLDEYALLVFLECDL